MSSEKDFTSIPVVDIKGLYSSNLEDRKAVSKNIGQAARNVGFLYIKGHDVPQDTIDGLIGAAKEFFALPYDEKMEYYIGKSKSHKGFVPEGEEEYDKGARPDHKEAFDVGYEVPPDHPLVKAKTPLLGPNRWPEIPEFHERVSKYYDAVMGLGRRLCQALALELGLPETYFDNLAQTPPSKMRLIHYPFDEDAKDAPGIGRHSDYELVTVLLTCAPGLEVMNDKGEWIDAPPIPGTFVINIGDALEIMTGGAFPSTAHRVRSVKEDRYSFPLFYAPDYHVEIKPLPQFAPRNSSDQQDYKAVTIGDHIWGQAIQSFKYLKKQVADGDLKLPEGSRGIASFGYFKRLAQENAAASSQANPAPIATS